MPEDIQIRSRQVSLPCPDLGALCEDKTTLGIHYVTHPDDETQDDVTHPEDNAHPDNVSRSTYVTHPESEIRDAGDRNVTENSGCNESVDNVRTPVSETVSEQRQVSALATSVGSLTRICQSTSYNKNAHRNNTQSMEPVIHERGERRDQNGTTEARQRSAREDKSQDITDIAQIDMQQLIQKLREENLQRRNENENNCDYTLTRRIKEMLARMKIGEPTEPTRDAEERQPEPTIQQEGSNRSPSSTTSKKAKRSRKQRRKNNKSQSETMWSEDVENYRGYKSIEELVNYITG